MRLNLIIALLLALSWTLSAVAYEVPQDATIKVFDASGKQIGSMSRREYKVVKVEHHEYVSAEKYKALEDKYAALEAAANGLADKSASLQGANASLQKDADVERARRKGFTYTAILGGGVGPGTLNHSIVNNQLNVSESFSPAAQGQLCASKDGVGVCAGAATNQFFSLGLKLDLNNK